MKSKKLLVFSFLLIINSFISFAQDGQEIGDIAAPVIFIFGLIFLVSLFGGGTAIYHKRRRERRFPIQTISRVNNNLRNLNTAINTSQNTANNTQTNITDNLTNINKIIHKIQNNERIENLREEILELIDFTEIQDHINEITQKIDIMLELIRKIHDRGDILDIDGILETIKLLSERIEKIELIKEEINHINETTRELVHIQEQIRDLLNKENQDSTLLIELLQQFNNNYTTIDSSLNNYNIFMHKITFIINQLSEQVRDGEEHVEESERINEVYHTLIESANKFNQLVSKSYKVNRGSSNEDKLKAAAIRRILRIERCLYKLFDGMDASEIQKNKENLKKVIAYIKKRILLIKGKEDHVFSPDLMRKVIHSESELISELKDMIIRKGLISDLRNAEKEIAVSNISKEEITRLIGRDLNQNLIINQFGTGFNHVYEHLKTSIEKLEEILH